MSDSICVKYGHDFELDLDGQVTCGMCGTMDDERDISGSYNGRRAVSETDNEGPTPSPEAEFDLNKAGYSTGKWSDDDDFGITPFLGPMR
jgi:hypothetical protein